MFYSYHFYYSCEVYFTTRVGGHGSQLLMPYDQWLLICHLGNQLLLRLNQSSLSMTTPKSMKNCPLNSHLFFHWRDLILILFLKMVLVCIVWIWKSTQRTNRRPLNARENLVTRVPVSWSWLVGWSKPIIAVSRIIYFYLSIIFIEWANYFNKGERKQSSCHNDHFISSSIDCDWVYLSFTLFSGLCAFVFRSISLHPMP